ncbi:MAG: cation diffusion facilitator family transporter [Candidatus Bipolaricaulota bacterium]|nr:cation diffusion facilitator family transporter [Candidatus Bipolaricaulota bacterium]
MSRAKTTRRLAVAMAIATGILALETVGGFASHSLALLSDAGHVLTDLLALGMTLFALRLAERPTNSRATFGYHRVGILVALANGISLIVVASLIVHEAYRRFVAPPAVNAVELLVIASVGLAANLAMLALLERGHNEDLNVRSAWLHVVGDSLGSVGVIASAIVLMITGWPYVDPIASVLIAFLILANGWGVVRDAAAILLELPPRTLSVKTIESGILAVEGVQGLHDLHLWAITPELPCLSAHVVVAEQTVSEAGEIVEAVSKKLEQMGIAHTTLQVEFERCDRAKGTCTLETLR